MKVIETVGRFGNELALFLMNTVTKNYLLNEVALLFLHISSTNDDLEMERIASISVASMRGCPTDWNDLARQGFHYKGYELRSSSTFNYDSGLLYNKPCGHLLLLFPYNLDYWIWRDISSIHTIFIHTKYNLKYYYYSHYNLVSWIQSFLWFTTNSTSRSTFYKFLFIIIWRDIVYIQ